MAGFQLRNLDVDLVAVSEPRVRPGEGDSKFIA